MNLEVNEIRKFIRGLSQNGESSTSKLTYIAVNKKSNLKLMTFNKHTKEYENSDNGTLVDDSEICDKNEFYLISQNCNSNNFSVNYKVVYDDFGAEYDDLQRFIYKLSHLYFNWNNSIRVPAPLQYVHKMIKMVNENLYEEDTDYSIFLPGSNLWEKHKSLYFL